MKGGSTGDLASWFYSCGFVITTGIPPGSPPPPYPGAQQLSRQSIIPSIHRHHFTHTHTHTLSHLLPASFSVCAAEEKAVVGGWRETCVQQARGNTLKWRRLDLAVCALCRHVEYRLVQLTNTTLSSSSYPHSRVYVRACVRAHSLTSAHAHTPPPRATQNLKLLKPVCSSRLHCFRHT